MRSDRSYALHKIKINGVEADFDEGLHNQIIVVALTVQVEENYKTNGIRLLIFSTADQSAHHH